MNSRQRRVRTIELTLTPDQVVVVWLRNAVQAGTFEEGARHSPPYRGAIANEVFRTVRNSMKGQPDPLVERAVLQARRKADSLFLLVVNANMAVLEGRVEREREYIILLGYLGAEIRGNRAKDRVEFLRLVVLMFIKAVLVLDAAIAQVASERLDGQGVLFRDSSVKLEEQLRMVEEISEHFNLLAREVDAAEINLEDLRNSLQSETDRQISIWVNQSRLDMLGVFGNENEMRTAMGQCFLLFGPKSAEASNNAPDT
jgi:hypothetical protein